MDKKVTPRLIVKHSCKRHGNSHGGAWKIAYADFVTAMMAFFLLLWLLGMVNVSKLKGIADYFQTPLFDTKAVLPPRPALSSPNAIALPQKIAKLVAARPDSTGMAAQVLVDQTQRGWRIQLMDSTDQPMFDRGSAQLRPVAKELLQGMAEILNDMGQPLIIAGHTDALPYAAGENGYSNWELSSDRAHAARRELLVGKLREAAVTRVEGLGSTDPWIVSDPLDARNRRITILLLDQATN